MDGLDGLDYIGISNPCGQPIFNLLENAIENELFLFFGQAKKMPYKDIWGIFLAEILAKWIFEHV